MQNKLGYFFLGSISCGAIWGGGGGGGGENALRSTWLHTNSDITLSNSFFVDQKTNSCGQYQL